MRFEKVSRFKDVDLPIPNPATENAAGFDLMVAEDIVIPPYTMCKNAMLKEIDVMNSFKAMTLNEVEQITKNTYRPTLVSTGMKCKLDPDKYLELSARSSTPLKYWLIVANSVGIIDADYYNNPSNEGEIFVQVINLAPFPIQLKRGDKIAQGIIHSYYRTEDAIVGGQRTGGFGSTSK